MLSRRIASASTQVAANIGAKPLPLIQRRTFFPPKMNSPKVIEEKYPEHPKFTDAEDPEMVCLAPRRNLLGWWSINWAPGVGDTGC